MDKSTLPQTFIDDLIALEDKNFYRHCGIDFSAMMRSLRQVVTSGRIISGGSTITMQVVNLYVGKPGKRTALYKLRQMAMAWNLEKRFSKDEILSMYLNMLPCGGQIYGIEAAARYYFGRNAAQLTRDEQLLLIGLPQGPNRYRPDSHPALAIWRRNVVLLHLRQRGRITEQEYLDFQKHIPRFRDFSLECWPTNVNPIFIRHVDAECQNSMSTRIDTAMDPSIQQLLTDALVNKRNELHGVKDGAGIVIENDSCEIRALVGTIPNGTRGAEQVDVTMAQRSPGSALKPFIYGEAINGGLITTDTLLDDTPLTLKDYRPANFDGTYHGYVTASDALSQSLNTPAVRLLRTLGVPRMAALLQKCNILDSHQTIEQYAKRSGLSMAIGGVECTLLNLACAYACLGRVPDCTMLANNPMPRGESYWNDGATAILTKMLRSIKLPNAPAMDIAWKSGTSNGNRDAWCIAFTPKWTVAIWFGNKNGRPANDLVGGKCAVPVAAQVLFQLEHGLSPTWPNDTNGIMEEKLLCANSGLTPSVYCTNTMKSPTAKDVPLKICKRCQNAAPLMKKNENARILSPAPGTYICKRKQNSVKFIWKSSPEEGHLYLDYSYFGIIKNGDELELTNGSHLIQFFIDGFYASSSVIVLERR